MVEMDKRMERRLFLWGGKAKARIIAHMAERAGYDVAVIFDPKLSCAAFPSSALFVNDPAAVRAHARTCRYFVACLGGEHGYARAKISRFCEAVLGLAAISLIHETAYISETARIGRGFQAMPHAVVHHFATIGDWGIVNTNAHVDHECVLGEGVHVMGGAALAGEVTLGDYATIGSNATVLPRLAVGAGAFIGAGAVVTRPAAAYGVYVGAPARYTRQRQDSVDDAVFAAITGGDG